ncbi:hypothetical protein JL720_16756 [Aureococcus anophagefferens]|nr:hypothetical protein JL720_16756 [Aureococcus anophagefferens]
MADELRQLQIGDSGTEHPIVIANPETPAGQTGRIFSATGSSDANNKVLQTMIQTQIQAMLSNKQIAAPATGGGVPFVTKHCDFHGECAHTTAECRVLQKDPNAKPDKSRNRNRSGNYRDRANDNNRDKRLSPRPCRPPSRAGPGGQAPPIDFGGSMNCMLNSYELLQTKNAVDSAIGSMSRKADYDPKYCPVVFDKPTGDAYIYPAGRNHPTQPVKDEDENEVKLYHNDNDSMPDLVDASVTTASDLGSEHDLVAFNDPGHTGACTTSARTRSRTSTSRTATTTRP